MVRVGGEGRGGRLCMCVSTSFIPYSLISCLSRLTGQSSHFLYINTQPRCKGLRGLGGGGGGEAIEISFFTDIKTYHIYVAHICMSRILCMSCIGNVYKLKTLKPLNFVYRENIRLLKNR